MTSAEWTPLASASALAASTATKPSLSTADKTLTIWRSPSSEPFSLRRTRSRLAGNSQSLNGAPLRDGIAANSHASAVPAPPHPFGSSGATDLSFCSVCSCGLLRHGLFLFRRGFYRIEREIARLPAGDYKILLRSEMTIRRTPSRLGEPARCSTIRLDSLDESIAEDEGGRHFGLPIANFPIRVNVAIFRHDQIGTGGASGP